MAFRPQHDARRNTSDSVSKSVQAVLASMRTLGPFASTAMAVLSIGGCATYSPKPLSDESLKTALATPDEPTLKVMASELADPALSSIDISLADGVNPDEAAVLSVMLNPSLRALRAKRGIASAETFNAGLLPDPTFSASVDTPFAGASSSEVTAFGLGIEYPIGDLVDRGARRTAARLSEQSIDLGVLWNETLVAARARALTYGVSVAGDALRFLDNEITLLEDNLARVRRAVSAGQLTAVDLSAARASLDTARTQRTTLAEQLANVRIELYTIMGFPPDANLSVHAEIPTRFDEPIPQLSDLLKTMENQRFDLLALRRGYESQEERVRAAILRQFPRFSIGPTLSRDTGDFLTLGFGLAVDLPVFNANRGQIAIQRATRQQLRQEYAARLHEARSSLARELNRLASAKEKLGSLRNAERSRASLVETYRTALEQGQVDVLSYYQARRDLIEARILSAQTAAQIIASRLLIDVISGARGRARNQPFEHRSGDQHP